MKCPKCNAEIAENAPFCAQCGARLAAESGGTEKAPPNVTARSGVADVPETEVWQGSYSPKALYGTWLLCGVATVVALLVGVFLGVGQFIWLLLGLGIAALWLYPVGTLIYQRMSVHYRLTTQRFFHERGVLRRVTDRIEVIDMDDISFEQGLIERFVGVGTIRITSSDRSDPMLVLNGIDNVAEVAAQIDSVRRAERLRRGVFVESV